MLFFFLFWQVSKSPLGGSQPALQTASKDLCKPTISASQPTGVTAPTILCTTQVSQAEPEDEQHPLSKKVLFKGNMKGIFF